MAFMEDKILGEAEGHVRRLLTSIVLNEQEKAYLEATVGKVHEVLSASVEAMPEADRLLLRHLVLAATLATLLCSPDEGRDYGPDMFAPRQS